ncbi:MAG: hypothetical protein IJ870_01290 [Alphaproteobacteria bacterium]|nr:hypothetical protein [Alphaproteobacteria bacterium]
MFKIIFYIVVIAIIVISGASAYHLYQVKEKNKTEMANFKIEPTLHADLGNVLVVYYSWTGHTKEIAEQIAALTNAKTYEIKTIKQYSSPSVYMESKKELMSKNYPELEKGFKPNIADYDTIFVGGPVWWYTMAPALFSFLQKTDFKGARVVPFSTQGSNYGKFFEDFAANAQNADILISENFNNLTPEYNAQVKNKIITWLNNLSK